MPEKTVILGHKDGIPIVLVEPRQDFLGGWQFWCDFCHCLHKHGRGLGHRCAHCFIPNSPFDATGYILKKTQQVGVLNGK